MCSNQKTIHCLLCEISVLAFPLHLGQYGPGVVLMHFSRPLQETHTVTLMRKKNLALFGQEQM